MSKMKRALSVYIMTGSVMGLLSFMFIVLPAMMSEKSDLSVGVGAAIVVFLVSTIAVVGDLLLNDFLKKEKKK